MEQKTEFKQAGSHVGSTIRQSLRMMAGRGVPNYTLVFLDPTKQNQRGESKNIVIPYLVMGRHSSCNVQYGEEYKTVSRQHASIQVDDNGCVLIHNPAAKNPTLVDGQQIVGNHRLKHGDEIQLSFEGPRIRFLSEQREKTQTMGFTRRMSMAMGQALRPYRRALWIIGFLLLAALAYSIWSTFKISDLNKEQIELQSDLTTSNNKIATLESDLDKEMKSGKEDQQKIKSLQGQIAKERRNRDRMQNELSGIQKKLNEQPKVAQPKKESADAIDNDLSLLSDLEDFVYHVRLIPESFNVKGTDQDAIKTLVEYIARHIGWQGTGFLTSDGKFITSRDIIEPWMYKVDNNSANCEKNMYMNILNSKIREYGDVRATFEAKNNKGQSFKFTRSLLTIDESNDIDIEMAPECAELYNSEFPVTPVYKMVNGYKTNWVYHKREDRNSKLVFDRNLSRNLNKGEKLYVLGYQNFSNDYDSPDDLEPFYSECTVARSGLSKDILYVTGMSFSDGLAGGPIFAKRNGKYIVVGIASHLYQEVGGVVPTANIF